MGGKRKKQIYDLEERTTKFGKDLIRFCKKLPRTVVTKVFIRQVLRSGTSIGANYCEADNAESTRDFIHKLCICRKEAYETAYWLDMIAEVLPQFREGAERLRQEAKELNLILHAIIRNTKENQKKISN